MIDYVIDGIFDFIILALTRRKQKGEEWRGVLEEKRTTGGYSLARKKHLLYFRTESGKKRKIRVGEAEFALYEKGKNYRKNRGDLLPDPDSGI